MDVSILWERLDRVLDPELDESIVHLGFVSELVWDGREARVTLRLPTYWCSPNFVYLMAEGVRRTLKTGFVRAYSVHVVDHFAERELSEGVSAGRSFCELFPDEAAEDLEEIRQRFLVKGYLSRLLVLVQSFRVAGATDTVLVAAQLADLARDSAGDWLVTPAGRLGPVRPRVVTRYLERRAELGLPVEPSSPLLLHPDGSPFRAESFPEALRRLRATVVNLRASTALCEALLASRQAWYTRERKEVAS